jgi:AsmA-like protein
VHVALLPLLKKDVQARSITIDGARVSEDGRPLVTDLALASSLRLAPDGTLEASGRLTAAVDLLAARPRAEATFGTQLAHGTLTVRSLDATMGPARITATGRVDGLGEPSPRARLDIAFKLGKSSVNGKIDALVDAASPTIAFDLDAPLVVLDDVLAWTSSLGAAPPRSARQGSLLAPEALADEATGPRGDGDLIARAKGSGTIHATRCLYRGFEMEDVGAKATLDRGALRLDDTRLSMFGGHARGTITSHPFEPARPFSLDQKAQGVAIGKMIDALAPAQKGTLEGTAALDLAITGRGGETPLLPTIDGSGALAVTNGKIASIGMIKQVMKLLEAAGAKGIAKDDTPFERLTAHFDVAKGTARTSDLQFRSADLDFDGTGTVGLGGALHLDLLGSFSSSVSAQLVAKTPALKIRQGSDGRLSVPLQVRGTMTAPQVGLDLDKVIHEGLKKEIQKEGKKKLLEKLFGR